MTSLASQSNTTAQNNSQTTTSHTAAVQSILSSLLDVHQFDPSQIKTDSESLEHWGKDWTKHFAPAAAAIVFPKSTEQVQAIVLLANEHNVVLTPSGGRTGLSAGAVAANGEIVVSMDKMNHIGQFYPADRMVEIEAGVVTEQLQQFAESKDLYYPVDFASAGSSQIGGNIGTNAGGIKVIRYGMTREWVSGLTVVTGEGEILELNQGLMKNATGYDLRHLFIGSEVTLGIIVDATIQLARQPENLTAVVLGVNTFDDIMKVLHAFQQKIDLTAFEFFSDKAMAHVLAHGVPEPFAERTPFYCLLEFEQVSEQVGDTAMELFAHCMEEGWVLDGVKI